MTIHPPSLYTGFVGCTVPFAFAVAALITGRLDHEWIVASRKWMLFAWMFLGIGNTLGMVWAYEEARVGQLMGVGPGRKRRVSAVSDGERVRALGHDPRAPRPPQGVERRSHLYDVFPHDLRHVPHALRRDRERSLLRAVVDRPPTSSTSSCCSRRSRLTLVLLPLAGASEPPRRDAQLRRARPRHHGLGLMVAIALPGVWAIGRMPLGLGMRGSVLEGLVPRRRGGVRGRGGSSSVE